ncbi:MAG: DnaJ C-terminal domain-containing protein [Planctomycetaceae bacterium]
MANHDYYGTLGVTRTATPEEIRKAHKKLSRRYHPDVNKDKGASEKFKQVQEAFDVLSDTEKRQQYDRFGQVFPGGAGPQPGRSYPWTGPAGGQGGPIDLGDLFGGQVDLEELFGGAMGGRGGPNFGRGGRRGPAPGQDVESEAEIPFQVAVDGGKIELVLDRGGKTERLTVKIPAGVDNGSVVRLSGQGLPGAGGGPAGDLLVRIRVAPHPWFRRDGHDLYLDVPITVTEAALGAKVEVPTLSEGRVVLTIPPGTASGAKLRLRGKGVMDLGTKERGDQYVVIKIIPPQKLSERARKLLQELAEEAPQSPRGGLW